MLVMPALALAQGAIAGQVKDASGAVLPGVTVEAASPVLIEKTRSAVTDGTGQFRIQDLRPGEYTVSFSLTGFSTVKREASADRDVHRDVNADMKVGGVEEGDHDGRHRQDNEHEKRCVKSSKRRWAVNRRARGGTLARMVAYPAARTSTSGSC
jgi:hypothetical protein